MALLCKNCAGTLVFDPERQKLICKVCDSSFFPEEMEDTDKDLLEEAGKLRDAKIYVCNNCGAEVELADSEAASVCLYCGSPAVAFSRIAKARRPERIIPFKITKEQAKEKLLPLANKAKSNSKYWKEFDVDKIHGIYIPYWIVTGTHYDAVERSVDRYDEDMQMTKKLYLTSKGRIKADGLYVYGSNMLSIAHLRNIDSWDLSGAVPFDEGYMAGYYSDATDIDYYGLKRNTEELCHDIFLESTDNTDAVITGRISRFEFTKTPEYILVPVWFMTLTNQDGSKSTFLMNGQTGQSYGSFPTEYYKGCSYILIKYDIIAVLSFILALFLVNKLYSIYGNAIASIINPLNGAVFVLYVILFIFGVRYSSLATKNYELTKKGSEGSNEYNTKRKET